MAGAAATKDPARVSRFDHRRRPRPPSRVPAAPADRATSRDATQGLDRRLGDLPFAYEGLEIVPLAEPELPEPPRAGEDGPEDCGACQDDQGSIWSDDDWFVRGHPQTALPAVLVLMPRDHFDFGDLPERLLAGLGPMLGRLEDALHRVPGTGRVHFNKWGDGGAHLHWFAFARPAGMQQLRGSCLFLWDDVLPNLPDDVVAANLATVSAALAEGGGRDHLATTASR